MSANRRRQDMELSDRQLKILQAVISDFINTAEPVGSRSLSKNHDLGVSAATIRNEMSDLEEMGYLTHPHTSAGRVPSEKAYRLYVNQMMNSYEMGDEMKNIISAQLNQDMFEFDKTIRHAAKILSEITKLTSFALTPKQDEDILKYINLLPVDDKTVILMIVSESGKVSNTVLHINAPYTEEGLTLLAKSMTYSFRGKTISEALRGDIITTFENDIDAMSGLAANIMPDFMKTLEDMLNVNLYMDGLTNIFSLPEYNDIGKAKSFIEMLNQKEAFTQKLINRDDGVIITIGNENCDENMQDCSMITATYHVDGKLIGKLGVIGPTRMKYSEVTSVIQYLTDNISNTFKIGDGEDD